MKENYTPRQLEILRFIVTFRRGHSYSPTLEEVGNALGVHRVTIHQHIIALEARGAVKRGPSYRRNIQVVDPDITGETEISEPVNDLLERLDSLRPGIANPDDRGPDFDEKLKEILEKVDLIRDEALPTVAEEKK